MSPINRGRHREVEEEIEEAKNEQSHNVVRHPMSTPLMTPLPATTWSMLDVQLALLPCTGNSGTAIKGIIVHD